MPDPVHVPATPVSVAPTTGVPLTVGGAVLTGVACDFAAELPFAKKLRSAASTPAVATQVLRDPPTALVSARRRRCYLPQMGAWPRHSRQTACRYGKSCEPCADVRSITTPSE